MSKPPDTPDAAAMSKPADTPDPAAAPQTDLREALSFLGHDAREGHSSTLALLELQRIKPDPMGMPDLIDRVERNARKSLAAIDDFMDMVAARSQPLRIEEVDLADLLVEVVADAWSLASRHGIRVQIASSVETAPVRADRDLLAGALAKVLRDAAARTPHGVEIRCGLSDQRGEWVLDIDDPGSGDAARRAVASPPRDGKLASEMRACPGWALAQVVAQRHGGRVRVEALPDAGSVFRIVLPHD